MTDDVAEVARRAVYELLDWAQYWSGRALCRVVRRHGRSCRGRRDHKDLRHRS